MDQQTLTSIVNRSPVNLPLSAALGELIETCPIRHTVGLTYAKYGLSGCALRDDWKQKFAAAVNRLPLEVKPIAVIYADSQTAKAPMSDVILQVASKIKCDGILIDTFDKNAGSLTDLWTLTEIESTIQKIQQANMFCALAGSLTERSIKILLPLEPEVIAVRSAACEADRQSQLDSRRLSSLVQMMKEPQEIAN